MKQTPTSPYAPDLEELRVWLQKMVAAMKIVELIAAVLAFITRMRDINLELTKRNCSRCSAVYRLRMPRFRPS